MEAYIRRELGVDANAARTLRDDFWHNHGTTMAGLMDVHDIDPDPFLFEVHEIDLSVLAPDPDLAVAIDRLPGRAVIYTNGSRRHGARVSAARGLAGSFAAIYGIEDADYIPKPRAEAFRLICARGGIDPACAVMVEDDPRNLEAPAAMGMTTVLVGSGPTAPHVHHQTDDLVGFLARAATWPTDAAR